MNNIEDNVRQSQKIKKTALCPPFLECPPKGGGNPAGAGQVRGEKLF